MIKDSAFLKIPIDFKNKFKIYPPSVNQIVSDSKFWTYFKVLTLSQEEIEDELADKITPGERFPTPFELLLNNCYHSLPYRDLTQKAFKVFINEEVSFLFEKKLIVIGRLVDVLQTAKSVDDLIILTEDEFFEFQNTIRQVMGENPIEMPDPDEDPRVKRIKAKARYRDKIKAKKGLGISLITCLASLSFMDMGLNPLNIGEMSYAAIGILMQTYQEKEKYHIDVESLQAGADSKKIKPKYWIRNL